MDSKPVEVIHTMSKNFEDRLKPIGGDLTGLKTYIERKVQDCRMTDEEALAAIPDPKGLRKKGDRLTPKKVGEWHFQARNMEEQLYEIHMFIGKYLYETRNRLAKPSRHHKGNNSKTFTQWCEENKDALGMSERTVRKYILEYEQFSLGIKPIPSNVSSDSTLAMDATVDSTQTHTEQGLQTLEKLYEETPELTPDVDPDEIKPMGRITAIEREQQLKVAWLKKHLKIKSNKELIEKAVDEMYVKYHDR